MSILPKKATTKIVSALMLSTSMLLASQAVAQQPDVGVNSAVKNEVSLTSAGSSESRPAVVKGPVYLQDRVQSGPDAALQILLKDQTVFTVGPNSSMVIDEFVYDPATANGTLRASIARGTFRFMSGRIASNPNNVKLNSPVATMGVRGTMIEGVIGPDAVELAESEGLIANRDGVDEENALLVVLRGPGRDNQGTNRRGELDVVTTTATKRLDEPGEAAFVPAAGSSVFGPFTLSVEALDVFSSNLRTAPTGEDTTGGGTIENVEEAAGGDTEKAEDTGVNFNIDDTQIIEDLTEVTEEPDPVDPQDPDFPSGPECQINPNLDGCG